MTKNNKNEIDFAAKDAKDAQAALKNVCTNNTKNTKNTKNIESAKNTKGRPTTTENTPQPDDYRFNARFTALQGEYLREKMFVDHKRSIVAVLQEIVEKDMEKNPDIVASAKDNINK